MFILPLICKTTYNLQSFLAQLVSTAVLMELVLCKRYIASLEIWTIGL